MVAANRCLVLALFGIIFEEYLSLMRVCNATSRRSGTAPQLPSLEMPLGAFDALYIHQKLARWGDATEISASRQMFRTVPAQANSEPTLDLALHQSNGIANNPKGRCLSFGSVDQKGARLGSAAATTCDNGYPRRPLILAGCWLPQVKPNYLGDLQGNILSTGSRDHPRQGIKAKVPSSWPNAPNPYLQVRAKRWLELTSLASHSSATTFGPESASVSGPMITTAFTIPTTAFSASISSIIPVAPGTPGVALELLVSLDEDDNE
ncbi:hypothetical protein DL770_010380 [Monosporascus sp. CRB-9-2]|nr:hypothetical protein DL770_010380 [Monosporascus sp. CRB-9-2]